MFTFCLAGWPFNLIVRSLYLVMCTSHFLISYHFLIMCSYYLVQRSFQLWAPAIPLCALSIIRSFYPLLLCAIFMRSFYVFLLCALCIRSFSGLFVCALCIYSLNALFLCTICICSLHTLFECAFLCRLSRCISIEEIKYLSNHRLGYHIVNKDREQ